MSQTRERLCIRNVDSPFTELFAILKSYEIDSACDSVTLGYETEQIRLMQVHIDNAVELLLDGLQDMGQLISRNGMDAAGVDDIRRIGQLISTMGNLTEALNVLRDDVSGTLKRRGAS